MTRRRAQVAPKRERCGGAALGDSSLPSTPSVGPLGGARGGSAAPPGLNESDDDGAKSLSSSTSSIESPLTDHGGRPTLSPSTIVTINVGGTIFTSYASTFCSEPSLLSSDIGNGFANTLWMDGHPYYDRDPKNFSIILNYFRGYPLLLTPDEALHVAQDAVYFDIKGLRRATGVDPSEINWTFQKGPGVSSSGTSFKSTEMVSFLGAGALLKGETAVTFLRLEKITQMAVGVVPLDTPQDSHIAKHPNTIVYDSMGEVSCRILSRPLPAVVPEGIVDAIHSMLAYDADVVHQQHGRINPLSGAASGASPLSGSGYPSPTLLAVSNVSPTGTALPRPPAPTLSIAATGAQQPSSILHALGGAPSSAMPIHSPAHVPIDQLFLQPIAVAPTSRQPSALPPMPSPIMPRLPSPPSAMATPQHLPIGDIDRDIIGQKYANFQMLPLLSSNVAPTSSAVPRAKDGDELCIVTHLSEDGSVIAVRFYRQQQLIHVAVGLGAPEPMMEPPTSDSVGGEASTAPTGKKGRRSAQDKATASRAFQRRLPLPPLQVALYTRSGATIHTSDAKFAPKTSSGRTANQTPFTPPLRPAEVNPNGTIPSTTPTTSPTEANVPPTTFNIIASTLLPEMTDTTQLMPIGQAIVEGYMSPQDPNGSTSTLPPTGGPEATTPPPPARLMPSSTFIAPPNRQQLTSNARQLRLLFSIVPSLSADLEGLGTISREGGPAMRAPEAHVRIVEASVGAFSRLEQALGPSDLSGILEYLIALPRFFTLTADMTNVLSDPATSAGEGDSSTSEWVRVAPFAQSMIIAGVRAKGLADNTIQGMSRRQVASTIYSLEGLEAKRRAAFTAVEALLLTSTANGSSPRGGHPLGFLTDLLMLFLPDPITLWNRAGQVQHQQQPQQQQPLVPQLPPSLAAAAITPRTSQVTFPSDRSTRAIPLQSQQQEALTPPPPAARNAPQQAQQPQPTLVFQSARDLLIQQQRQAGNGSGGGRGR